MRISALLCLLALALPALAETPEEAAARLRERSKPFYEAGYLLGGHRGGMFEYPENTVYGFEHASKDFPGLLIECDVHTTKDGQVVVLHDLTVDRTTDGTGPVARMTLEEVKKLDAAYKFTTDKGASFPLRGQGITIPTFDEALAALPESLFLVEIKAGAATPKALAEAIRKHNAQARVVVASFSPGLMTTFRKEAPDIGTCFDTQTGVRMMMALRSDKWDSYVPTDTLLQADEKMFKQFGIDAASIAKLQAKGVLIGIYSLNTPELLAEYKALGVNNILTDAPSVVAK